MSLSDDYENWQRRLNGEEVPIYEDNPECGFYKVRLMARSKQYLPVSIFKHNGEYVAMKNGKPLNANNIWMYAIKNPITEKEYNELMEMYHGE